MGKVLVTLANAILGNSGQFWATQRTHLLVNSRIFKTSGATPNASFLDTIGPWWDGLRDGPTDKASYRDAGTHLKMKVKRNKNKK